MIQVPTLSPSAMTTFDQCPQKFAFQKLDLWGQSPTVDLLRGTVVHDALRRLYSGEAQGARTREAAQNLLDAVIEDVSLTDDYLNLEPTERYDLPWQAALLIDNYFEMEDPNAVRAIGIELHLAMRFAGVLLHGHLDRLDATPAGTVVVDYKTGKAPSRRYREQPLRQLFVYAYLVEEVVGAAPVGVRLVYLRDRVEIREDWNEKRHLDTALGVSSRLGDIRSAIAADDFETRVSALCNWCAYQPVCPAFSR